MNELRMKKLKERWIEIQKKRDEKKEQQAIFRTAQRKIRQLSQEIPNLLDSYNEAMI